MYESCISSTCEWLSSLNSFNNCSFVHCFAFTMSNALILSGDEMLISNSDPTATYLVHKSYAIRRHTAFKSTEFEPDFIWSIEAVSRTILDRGTLLGNDTELCSLHSESLSTLRVSVCSMMYSSKCTNSMRDSMDSRDTV